ncbi:MAG: SUMF1/EgtB/PvdO family nonheme iron enzyme [Gemmataceae bacterium]
MSRSSAFSAAALRELPGFFDAIVEAGSDFAPQLILADWLEEHDRTHEAELLRLQAALAATCCEHAKHPERVQQQARVVELLAAGVLPCLPRRTVALAEGVDMTFAWIPPGTFLMGSPPKEPERGGDNETPHFVTLPDGFYLGIHAVTQAQWQAMMGNNPSHFKGENLPVDTASWQDSQKFCKKFSQRDGKHYRLPTEAEWEYACRAGTTTPFHFGKTINTDQVNYNGSNYPYGKGKKGVYRRQTTTVGSFPPNPWGLFDMHGNIWEWCQDWYGPYENSRTKDPSRTKKVSKSDRVLRGGSYDYFAWFCRAAARSWNPPNFRGSAQGFRVAFHLGVEVIGWRATARAEKRGI